MKRAIFFSANEWAFGTIHYDLTKFLFGKSIEAELLPWNISYNLEEFADLDRVTDVYLSTTYGVNFLTDDYHIDASKVVAVAHGVVDIEYLIEHKGRQAFNKFKEYAVVSEHLKRKSQELGIKRVPKVLPLGVNTARFKARPAKELKTVGYAGDFNGFHKQIKRGELAEKVVKEAGLEFKVAQFYHNNFVTMAGFYNAVDCVIISSSEEGAGLPAMEAGAAGRLVISTPVGHWPERIGEKGGHMVSIDKDKFLSETVALLKKYKADPESFRKKCESIQKHATSYDWNRVIEPWVKILS